jgi:aminopeptidase N
MVSLANSRVYRHCRSFDLPGNLGAGLVALMLLALASGSALAESNYSFESTPGKLPKTVIPVHYAIEITPDLDHLTLAGNEVIDIEVREPTARLILNAVDMSFSTATLDDNAQRADVALDAATEAATLTVPQPLAAGAHRLRIGFTARINSFGRGLFFVDYPTS